MKEQMWRRTFINVFVGMSIWVTACYGLYLVG